MIGRGKHSRGYTLVEVMIVVAVVGIMSAAALPLFQPEVAVQLKSFGQIVASDLQYVRNLAVTNNTKYRVTFEPAQNRYYLEHSGTNAALNTLPDSIYHNTANTTTKQYTDLDELPQLGAGANIAAVLAPASPPTTATTLEFDSLGATTQADETVIWLTSGAGEGQRFIAVRVNPVTGLAELDEITSTAPAAGS